MYISAILSPAVRTQADVDALYADRANLTSARRAADILWRELQARPENFEYAWKLSRVAYWLGTHAPQAERRGFIDQGIQAGETAQALRPDRPEGLFWTAANMGEAGEKHGMRVGLKYRKPIKESLEKLLKIDPAFLEGAADRALGRWYHKVPRMLGGDRKKAESHLRASLRHDPNSILSHLFLAELFIDDDRKSDARTELAAVLNAPFNPHWAPEEAGYKQRAEALLARIK